MYPVSHSPILPSCYHFSPVSSAEPKWSRENYRILMYKRECNSISIDPLRLSKPAENRGIALGGKKSLPFLIQKLAF